MVVSYSRRTVILYSVGHSCVIMKEIDDTPLPKSESEVNRELDILPLERLTRQLVERLEALELRIANLETQRTPADNNMDDPEWY